MFGHMATNVGDYETDFGPDSRLRTSPNTGFRSSYLLFNQGVGNGAQLT